MKAFLLSCASLVLLTVAILMHASHTADRVDFLEKRTAEAALSARNDLETAGMIIQELKGEWQAVHPLLMISAHGRYVQAVDEAILEAESLYELEDGNRLYQTLCILKEKLRGIERAIRVPNL